MGWIRRRSTMLLAVLSVGGITIFLTFFQLNTLLPGANNYEQTAINVLNSFPSSLLNPINAPYYIVAKFFDIFFSPLLALRITSALTGIAVAGLFFYILRQWFNNRIAIAGTLFIVMSSWYLTLARIGSPFIMSTFWLAMLFALGTWRTYTTKPFRIDLLLVTTVGLSLYTPYYCWLVILGIIIMALRRRRQFFILPRRHQWFLPLIFISLIIPLVILCIRDIQVLKNLTGLYDLPSTFAVYLHQVAQNVAQILFRGNTDPALNLGRLALLDIFSVVMLALGAYYFERRLHLRRSQILFSTGLVLTLLISLSPFALGKLAILFPIIMIFAVGGIVELLTRWLRSFPRNPIARSVGVCVIVVTIGFTSFYHLQRYFVAWAGNPDVATEHTPQQ